MPIKPFIVLAYLLAATTLSVHAQNNLSGLADPLTMADGSKVTTAKQWHKRRKELLHFFTTEMYGQQPKRPASMTFKVSESSKTALGGLATRKQVTVYFNGKPNGPQMDLLIYLPNQVKKPGVILQLGFNGNQTLSNDTAVKISSSWVANGKTAVNNKATEASRGKTPNADVEMILKRGYGFATIYCGDIDPDFDDGFKNGVHALYPKLQGRGDNFSTIGAWAWGLSRALDYLETDKDIDAKKVVVFGFSRLGKAALWAGATDQRFAMVLSNESGAGGVRIFRRGKGEDIKHLCTSFPHWFDANFRKYIGRDTLLPFDQHLVISLVAPRPIAIGSALGDQYSDPEGEFLGGVYASPVYRLLGTTGLPATQMPGLNEPVAGQIQYHIRPGNHNILTYDWQQYLNFMDKHFK
ncbi:MAG: acetylxylan esterase [Mucilaginibacter sp.]|nr:acetylxylan esterase [Mucilaginibacter sp.]